MKALPWCALTVLLAACCPLPADDRKPEPVDAKKLVGRWRVKDEKGESLFNFELGLTRDGRATLALTAGAETRPQEEGTYTLDGNKLVVTWKKPAGGGQKVVFAVVRLTDTEMVHAVDKGREVTLVRVKDR